MKHQVCVLFFIFLFSSCSKSFESNIVVRSDSVSIENPKIAIALVTSQRLEGDITISAYGYTIGQGSIIGKSKASYLSFDLDLSCIKDGSDSLFIKMFDAKKIELTILVVNERKRIKLENIFLIDLTFPPISNILSIEMNGKKYDKKNTSRVSILRSLFLNRTNVFENTIYMNPVYVFNTIKVKIIVDTVYHKTFITCAKDESLRWVFREKDAPSKNETRENQVENDLKKKIRQNKVHEIIPSSYKMIDNGRYVIEEEIPISELEQKMIYLVNIDENNRYFIYAIGAFGVIEKDRIKPVFRNAPPPLEIGQSFPFSGLGHSINGNEGFVYMVTKDFYGYSPYLVPFVGKAYGDIAEIYVDGQAVKFRCNEEFFFKKRIYLDGGYNRIPIKIVDDSGNITESYIPVTLEYIEDNRINIENNNIF